MDWLKTKKDGEEAGVNIDQKGGLISDKGRYRSSRRLRHEAEVEVFKTKAGDLDEVRKILGLRPSQICEILKVHPSAWTRWTKTKKAPPHIYQMLEWYVELLKWRGQNNPLQTDSVLPKKIRVQSPDTYLPEQEPLSSDKQQALNKVEFGLNSYDFNGSTPLPNNYIEKKALLTILFLSFTLQTGLTVILYLWLKHH